MIYSSRPSERLPLFSHYVLPHIYDPCITVDLNAVSMVPIRCCQCTQFAQLCFAPTAMKLSHCVLSAVAWCQIRRLPECNDYAMSRGLRWPIAVVVGVNHLARPQLVQTLYHVECIISP